MVTGDSIMFHDTYPLNNTKAWIPNLCVHLGVYGETGGKLCPPPIKWYCTKHASNADDVDGHCILWHKGWADSRYSFMQHLPLLFLPAQILLQACGKLWELELQANIAAMYEINNLPQLEKLKDTLIFYFYTWQFHRCYFWLGIRPKISVTLAALC